MRDLVRFDGPKTLRRIEAPVEHDCRADHGITQIHYCRSHVIERHADEHAIRRPRIADHAVGQSAREQAAMGEHDALGLPGRAAGID